MFKKIIALILCLGCAFMLNIGNINANETDPGQIPVPTCTGPFCWIIG